MSNTRLVIMSCVTAAVNLLTLLLSILTIFKAIPFILQTRLNRISPQSNRVSKDAATLHDGLFIVDLHCDSLVWNRNLLKRHNYGHVDIPRLISGNVSLQVFAIPTKLPWFPNFESNPSTNDMITPLAIAQAWPLRTWTSPLQRALYLGKKLDSLVKQSSKQLMIVKNVTDLDELLKQRTNGHSLTGAILSIEGAHALENELDNLDILYEVGFRMIGLTHFFDNEAGGSAHGIEKRGLTDFGRELVARMMKKNLLIDLAHASPNLIEDVCDLNTGPLVVSHSGVRGICDSPRNLSDQQIRWIAASNGVIGITMFKAALCGDTIEDIVRSISYTVNVGGVDCVALGSDFDGTTLTPIDASGMVHITDNLMKHGFSEEDIAKIMGGNILRVLRQSLPTN